VLKNDLPTLGFDDLLNLKHVQLWFGVGEKKNPMHLDNNENIMFMISGSKKFRLLSPGQREFVYPVIRSHNSAVSSDANGTSMHTHLQLSFLNLSDRFFCILFSCFR
jgi:hypothetical protein